MFQYNENKINRLQFIKLLSYNLNLIILEFYLFIHYLNE